MDLIFTFVFGEWLDDRNRSFNKKPGDPVKVRSYSVSGVRHGDLGIFS